MSSFDPRPSPFGPAHDPNYDGNYRDRAHWEAPGGFRKSNAETELVNRVFGLTGAPVLTTAQRVTVAERRLADKVLHRESL